MTFHILVMIGKRSYSPDQNQAISDPMYPLLPTTGGYTQSRSDQVDLTSSCTDSQSYTHSAVFIFPAATLKAPEGKHTVGVMVPGNRSEALAMRGVLGSSGLDGIHISKPATGRRLKV